MPSHTTNDLPRSHGTRWRKGSCERTVPGRSPATIEPSDYQRELSLQTVLGCERFFSNGLLDWLLLQIHLKASETLRCLLDAAPVDRIIFYLVRQHLGLMLASIGHTLVIGLAELHRIYGSIWCRSHQNRFRFRQWARYLGKYVRPIYIRSSFYFNSLVALVWGCSILMYLMWYILVPSCFPQRYLMKGFLREKLIHYERQTISRGETWWVSLDMWRNLGRRNRIKLKLLLGTPFSRDHEVP